MHLNIVTFNRKEGKELTMRYLTVTTMTAPATVATMATLTQEGSSITNQIPLALYQVQAGPVGLPRLHLQIVRSPHQTAALSCILMAVAQRMVEMVPGLALVCTGALRIPGTCLSAHVK